MYDFFFGEWMQAAERQIHARMEEEYKRALEVEKEKEMQRWEESVRYQEQLEKQLAEKERLKQEAYEEFLKEKLMIDEIVRKIYEEDQRYEYQKHKNIVFGACMLRCGMRLAVCWWKLH